MEKGPSTAEKNFALRLRDADSLLHDYLQQLDRYYLMPDCDEIILNRLERAYGEPSFSASIDLIYPSDAWEELEDSQRQARESPPEDEGGGEAQDEDVEDLVQRLSDPASADEREQLRREMRIRSACNTLMNVITSLCISTTNLCGTQASAARDSRMLPLITHVSLAYSSIQYTLNSLFPSPDFPAAAAYAERARHLLNSAEPLILDIFVRGSEAASSRHILSSVFQEARRTLDSLLDDIRQFAP